MAPATALFDGDDELARFRVLEWRVAVGAQVAEGDTLCAAEMLWATVDVPSPRAGRVTRLLAPLGELLSFGHPLCDIDSRHE